jgi:hypothetical protein
MSPFEQHGVAHLSPSSLNLWLAAPSLWVLEKLLGHRGGMGCAAHRGTAVELGVSAGLFDPALDAEACIAIALPHYDKLTALNSDSKRADERAVIPGMVRQGLALRSHGLPIMPNGESRFGGGVQHKVEIQLDGVDIPVIGYLDWLYAEEVLDLKSTLRIPSVMSPPHLRQAAVYKTAHMGRRVRFSLRLGKESRDAHPHSRTIRRRHGGTDWRRPAPRAVPRLVKGQG